MGSLKEQRTTTCPMLQRKSRLARECGCKGWSLGRERLREQRGTLCSGGGRRVAPAVPLFSPFSLKMKHCPYPTPLTPTPGKAPEPGEVSTQAEVLIVRAEGRKDRSGGKSSKCRTHRLGRKWKFSQSQADLSGRCYWVVWGDCISSRLPVAVFFNTRVLQWKMRWKMKKMH